MMLANDAVEELADRIRRDVDDGIVPAANVALALDGEVVVDERFGAAEPGDRFCVFSVTKVLPSAAIWRLVGAGELAYERPVRDVLGWFTGDGKEEVLLEHVMCHTSGFPHAPLGAPEWFDPGDRRRKMASWQLESPPGARFEYHGTTAAWVLAEMIAAITGRDHRDAIHELVTEPLGLPRLLGIDDTKVRVIDMTVVAPRAADQPEVPEITIDDLGRFNGHDVRELGVPAGGGCATAAHIAMLYQGLLDDRQGLFDPAVLAGGTTEIRVTLHDDLRMCPANRSLGLIVAGDDGHAAMRGFAQAASPHTFGHDGATGQIAWADPETGLSMCFVGSDIDGDVIRQYSRSIGVSDRALACVRNA